MADASYIQTSFLGGEWSPLIQGRMDDPRYRSGMNVCRNILPLEEGSGSRRPGTRLIGPTRKGRKAVLRSFDFQQSHPYSLELTNSHLRFLAGAGIVVESFGKQFITSVSAAKPAVIATAAAHGWATGDEVLVQISPGEVNATVAPLLGLQLEITVLSSTTFSVADAVTGAAIDGTAVVLGSTDLSAVRIADFTTPYQEADLQAINQVQDQTTLLLLHKTYKPQSVQSTSPEQGSTFAIFTVGAATFTDGPYLDPPTDGTTITPSGTSGSVTLTLAGGSTRFASTDVGRMVRLFSEPAAWAIGTAYNAGDQVKFNNAYYQALKANTGNEPDLDVINWGVSTTAAVWNWATITAFTDTTHVTATLVPVTNADGTAGPNLPRTTACVTWRLGLYSDTTGYPACGTYHEGRLWLSGVVGNRIDGSMSNKFFTFQPTFPDGTIADNNAIAAVFNAKDVNQIFWMEPDERGIIAGTQAGEWLIQASQQNDPLTPTSIQAHRRTNYGCANVPPKRTGITVCFVQRYAKKLLEYITTDFRGLSAHNIALTGKHLTQKGIVEIAYQAEKVPTIWARTADGALLSCTYKRESPYASDPPAFAGWAHHDLGGGLTVESIQAGPNFDGTLDAVSVVVSDGTSRWNLLVTDLFDVDWTIGDSLFVDFAETPSMWEVIAGTPSVIRLYGLHYLAGKNVDVFAGGIDCGTIAVAADGHLDIPIDSATIPLLTSTWLASLNSSTNFHSLGLAIVRTLPGVGNTPDTTGIQNFDITGLTSPAAGVADVDWDGHRLFTVDTAHSLILVNDITTFKELAPVYASGSANAGITYAEDGFLYGVTAATNCSILHKMDPSNPAADISTFGVNTASFLTTASSWATPWDFDTVPAGDGSVFLVSTSQNAGASNNEMTVLNLGIGHLSPIKWTGFSFNLDEPRGVVCRGNPLFGNAQAHILAPARTDQAATLGFYRVFMTLGLVTKTKVGLLNASTFATGWTHVTNVYGMILDETDGNLIVHASQSALAGWNNVTTYVIGQLASNVGHDFVSLQNANLANAPAVGGTAFWQDLGPTIADNAAIFKLNSHTGAVMWSNTIGASIPGVAKLNSSRVRNSKYCFVDNVNSNGVREINTSTGVMTTAALNNTSPSYQFYNDFTGEIIFFANFVHSTNPPALIGTTPSSFTSWATLGPAAGPAYPAALPPSNGVTWTVPVAIGYAYPSQGQILRAIAPQESGAQNGPALGKTRRSHMYATLLQQTQGIKFGTDFTSTRTAQLRSKGGIPLPLTTLFSSVHQDTLTDDYSFDSMLCWEIDRPYPATVCTLGAFLHTQDR